MPEVDVIALSAIAPEQWRRFANLHCTAGALMLLLAEALEAKDWVRCGSYVRELESLGQVQTAGRGLGAGAAA